MDNPSLPAYWCQNWSRILPPVLFLLSKRLYRGLPDARNVNPTILFNALSIEVCTTIIMSFTDEYNNSERLNNFTKMTKLRSPSLLATGVYCLNRLVEGKDHVCVTLYSLWHLFVLSVLSIIGGIKNSYLLIAHCVPGPMLSIASVISLNPQHISTSQVLLPIFNRRRN